MNSYILCIISRFCAVWHYHWLTNICTQTDFVDFRTNNGNLDISNVRSKHPWGVHPELMTKESFPKFAVRCECNLIEITTGIPGDELNVWVEVYIRSDFTDISTPKCLFHPNSDSQFPPCFPNMMQCLSWVFGFPVIPVRYLW